MTIKRAFLRVGLTASVLAATASVALAQTTLVRVTRDDSTIWQAGFQTPALVVPAGTLLTVVAPRGDWYEVVVPRTDPMVDAGTGFIFKGNVEVARGSAPASSPQPAPAAAERSSDAVRRVGVVGFVEGGYTRFAAHNSFKAVLRQPGGALFGAGGEVRFAGRLFVNGSVERFDKTGERVFVLDGEVFRLGTPNRITILPVMVTAGWRFENEHATPYVGGGMGRIFYKERPKFADAGESVDSRHTSYHVLGGIEFRNNWVATAFEVQYSQVPDALGRAGASAAFGESDLGGVGGRIKILIGR